MTPNVDNAHVSEAQALLTEMFRDKANIRGILGVLAKQIQKLEDAAWEVINGRILGTSVGDALDKIGKIVGAARNGLDDTDYTAAIHLQIRVNRSQGLMEDLIQITALYANDLLPFTYAEYPTAEWEVALYGSPSPLILATYLNKAKAAGTHGRFIYSTWPHSEDLLVDSSYGGVTAPLKVDSFYGGVSGTGLTVTVLEIP